MLRPAGGLDGGDTAISSYSCSHYLFPTPLSTHYAHTLCFSNLLIFSFLSVCLFSFFVMENCSTWYWVRFFKPISYVNKNKKGYWFGPNLYNPIHLFNKGEDRHTFGSTYCKYPLLDSDMIKMFPMTTKVMGTKMGMLVVTNT